MSEYKPKTKGERVIGEQLKNGVTDPEEIAKKHGVQVIHGYIVYSIVLPNA